MADNYDVIIIGAGSIGVPLAMALAERKMSVLTLDGEASPGQGQNKCAIGGVRATHSDGAKIKACLRSLETFSSWEKTYGEDIGWIRGGYAFPVYTERDEAVLKELLKVQRGFGLNIDWAGPGEMRALVPGIAAKDLRGGTYSPEDGSASPLLSINAFYRRAVKLGAEFRFKEPVKEILSGGGEVKGVLTPQGRYFSKWVVNAAGGDAAAVSDLAGIKVPVTPDCHEAGITEPAGRFFEPMVVDIRPGDRSKNYYFYQNREGQIVFCLTPQPPVWGHDRRSTSEFLPEVSRRMIALLPGLANLKVRRTWRGLYPMTPDGFPVVDFPEALKGYVLAVGMCGQGFMLGPGLGAAIAAHIAGAPSADDGEILAGFRLERSFTGQEKLK
ncbi:MAG: sulfurtransferase [Elusimicrobia bacterium RIFOXYA2_FULL_58_8]|nr:MAG: sulfurtransferase [Elusimicrobia bacterium RIFOXYA12_FULL_57_11]OGS16522.1 MAG: sulfurtransferase [Elusimicrobia bacterium RIFOXYA2_FULL_58_8]